MPNPDLEPHVIEKLIARIKEESPRSQLEREKLKLVDRFIDEVLKYLLFPTKEEAERARQEFRGQILYSARRLTEDLVRYCAFTQQEAEQISWQVATQATLFGRATATMSDGEAAFLPWRPEGWEKFEEWEKDRYQKERRENHYTQLLPVFILYLFDKVMDDFYDTDEIQDEGVETLHRNHIQAMIDQATALLGDDPHFYQEKLSDLLDISWEYPRVNKRLLDDSDFVDLLGEVELAGVALLVPFIELLKDADVTKEEAVDILTTVKDALTNGQLSLLIWRHHYSSLAIDAERTSEQADSKVAISTDLLYRKTHPEDKQRVSYPPAEALSQAILDNQGYLTVANLIDVMSRLIPLYNRKEQKFDFYYDAESTPRALDHYLKAEYPGKAELIDFLLLMKSIVRLGDDIFDLPSDKKHHTPNINHANYETREVFFQVAGINRILAEAKDGLDLPETLVQLLLSLREHVLHPEKYADQKQYVKELFDILGDIVTLSGNRIFVDQPMTDEEIIRSREFVSLVYRNMSVVRGSLISGSLPDEMWVDGNVKE